MSLPLLIIILLSTINNLPLYLIVKRKISFYITLCERLVSAETNVHVFISAFLSFFFFFFQRMNSKFIVQRQKLLFMHCSSTVYVL